MNLGLYLEKVRIKSPLVHNMTNQVVANDVANVLIASGASPIMAYAIEEVEEVAGMSQAVVLNIGTITQEIFESMIKAGRAANSQGVPVILDPVGVGATAFRRGLVKALLKEIQFTLIRGNSAEIAHLAGIDWASKGVDAMDGDGSKEEIARILASKQKCLVAISGKEDYISDGNLTYRIDNGHNLMGKITGSGCMLSGLTGAFIGAEPDDKLTSIVAAHVTYGIAGEQAAKKASGPGSFKPALFDALYQLTAEEVNNQFRIERIEK